MQKLHKINLIYVEGINVLLYKLVYSIECCTKHNAPFLVHLSRIRNDAGFFMRVALFCG